VALKVFDQTNDPLAVVFRGLDCCGKVGKK